jgi:hypothetical protein
MTSSPVNQGNNFMSRKFILAVLVEILATCLLAFGKLSGAEWVTATIAVAGAYMTANVVVQKQ